MGSGGPPDLALRVPRVGGGPVGAAWETVRRAAGIPVLLADPAAYLGRPELAWAGGIGADAGTDALGALEQVLPALGFETLSFLARYGPALHAEATPLRQVVARFLAQYAPARAKLAVEAGCSVGAELRTLRLFAERVVGFDANLAALLWARAQLAGEPVPQLVRREGRIFDRADDIVRPALDGVTVVVGDAHDPPLGPATADIVLALNLLDNVRDPLLVLGQLDALLKPGGLLLLGSPFAWNDAITPPEAQLGGTNRAPFAGLDSPTVLARVLAGDAAVTPRLGYELLGREDVAWELRDHARCVVRFEVHVIAARKHAAG